MRMRDFLLSKSYLLYFCSFEASKKVQNIKSFGKQQHDATKEEDNNKAICL